MFRWWGKKDRSVDSSARPTASEVDAEYSEYRSRIQKPMLQGALVGGLGSALFYLLAWMSSVSAAQQASPDSPSSPTIVLAPLPASMTVAGFSLLAAIAIALQLAVRTPSEAETRPATVLARRRFLCEIARLVVLGSFTLAAYATIPVLTSAPHILDVVRLFAPAILGTLVGLVAADAGVASDPDFAPAELGRVWRARVARRTLIGLRMVGDQTSAGPDRGTAWQAAVLVLVPVLIGVASTASAPELGPWQRIGLVLTAVAVAVLVYAITVRVYLDAVAHDWVNVIFTVVLTAAVGAAIGLTIATMMLQRTANEGSSTLAPTLTVEGWALVYVAVPAVLAAWCVMPSRDARPRALGWAVRAVLVRKLNRRHLGLNPRKGPAFNRLALAAPWLSVFLPFGMILAIIAKQQIRRVNASRPSVPQRGDRAANLAIVLTILFFVAFISAAFISAALDLQDWRHFVWG